MPAPHFRIEMLLFDHPRDDEEQWLDSYRKRLHEIRRSLSSSGFRQLIRPGLQCCGKPILAPSVACRVV